MAEIAEGGGGGHGKGGKKRAKKQSTKVDMTPMVDLAFLLLTFFVLTATFNKNKAMDITFPAPLDPNQPPPPAVKNAVTFLLTKDHRIFYYEEEFVPVATAMNPVATVLKETTYAPEGGVEDLLMAKNSVASEALKKLEEERKADKMEDSTYKKKINSINNKQTAVTVIIKADGEAKYRDVVLLIDELKVLKISKFVNVDITKPEYDMVTTAAATK
ncbi:MAG: biopolymer transporter ExbD [Bacteroidia bacterium]|nr:biopolymer transporter ExbD [Bacteroidia bacterium]